MADNEQGPSTSKKPKLVLKNPRKLTEEELYSVLMASSDEDDELLRETGQLSDIDVHLEQGDSEEDSSDEDDTEGGSGIIETITDSESDDGEDNMPLVKVRDLFWESYEHFAGKATSGSSKRKRKQRSAFVGVLDDEIKLYQSHPVISRNKTPVQWWNDNKLKFPNLFPQAAIYLSGPAGSVPSEQVFPEASNIYDSKRSRLTPDRAESLLFLHHNLPKRNYQY
ncbi:hypothetical protein JTB14_008411 [Gonioctena quinquepunctata]|nr:hypothetical protein JTB14_008411 [Gonioctena quinquepunctata]